MAKVAMLVAGGFEDSEFTVPFDAFRNAGHEVTVIGTKAGEVAVGKGGQASATIDRAASAANPAEFDVLVIPGAATER